MISDKTIRSYFLGTLDEEGRRRVEECLISDRNFFEQVMITEDELIDDYLDDRLSDPEKTGFVTHFLETPRQFKKLMEAQAIKRFMDDESEPAESPETVNYGNKLYFWWRRVFAASL